MGNIGKVVLKVSLIYSYTGCPVIAISGHQRTAEFDGLAMARRLEIGRAHV